MRHSVAVGANVRSCNDKCTRYKTSLLVFCLIPLAVSWQIRHFFVMASSMALCIVQVETPRGIPHSVLLTMVLIRKRKQTIQRIACL